jgi:NAD(P)-dependent dehydrogenase (short-subunit alcohol dehydrogenase family)
VLVGRRPGLLDDLAAAHPAGRMHPYPADVTDESAVVALFDHVVDRYGRLDLLFNNAGIGAPPKPIDEVSLADWQAVVDVNLTATFLCTREAFRAMRRQHPQGGRIINNGSIAAHSPRPRSAAYAATKHAVSGLTKATSLDGRPYDIACGQIDIGNAHTSMTATAGDGLLQPDGSVRPEPTMDVGAVARAVTYMASLPLDANVAELTVLATKMPYLGRG